MSVYEIEPGITPHEAANVVDLLHRQFRKLREVAWALGIAYSEEVRRTHSANHSRANKDSERKLAEYRAEWATELSKLGELVETLK